MTKQSVKHAVGWVTDHNGHTLRSLSPAIIACTGKEKSDEQRRSLLDEFVTCKRCLAIINARTEAK
jgi:hypothetical protein